jgi:D-alanyl-D-alanine carboxypeptidase/D-alanyl-D-alanine-endopeptidase (penicillin-binding protein 4)
MSVFDFRMILNRRVLLRTVLTGMVAFTLPAAAQELKVKQSVKMIVTAAGLSGSKSIVVMDAQTGQVLESYKGAKSLPPASVTKVATALYALDALGADTTFKTRLLITGPIKDGVLKGNLILEGSGDPRLDTDALGALAEQLKAKGVRAVRGKFYVYAGALPYQHQIDPDQPDHVGYNPSIDGINLNFNRVFFQWKRGSNGYTTTMMAQARRYTPEVHGIKMMVKNRDLPVFSYRSSGNTDKWSVARSALGNAGSRWLPVRQPADYAGEVFRAVAAINGVRIPKHKVIHKPMSGQPVAVWESGRVYALAKSMIKYSTNMTAEALGLNATVKRGGSARSLRSSAQEMSRWLEAEYGVRGAKFVDHSGLGSDSRVSAHEMARLLVNAKWDGPLRPIMKEVTLRDAGWKKAPISGAKIVVKTGTLNFASALAGYVKSPNGRKLVFAIFTADMKKRASIAKKDRERPEGGQAWARKARIMQHQLLRYWVQKYGT